MRVKESRPVGLGKGGAFDAVEGANVLAADERVIVGNKCSRVLFVVRPYHRDSRHDDEYADYIAEAVVEAINERVFVGEHALQLAEKLLKNYQTYRHRYRDKRTKFKETDTEYSLKYYINDYRNKRREETAHAS